MVNSEDAGTLRQQLARVFGRDIAHGYIDPEARKLAREIAKLTGLSFIQIFKDAAEDYVAVELGNKKTMDFLSLTEQRRRDALSFRLDCLNAKDEVPCSECDKAVNEARANRNANELKREGVRMSTKPICNECQASWRYSHHQQEEMANDNGFSDADIHAKAQEMFKTSWDNLSSRQQDEVYAALEKEMKNDDKIMVHCDSCNKTFYESPDGDGLCPDCKKKDRKNDTANLPTYCYTCGVGLSFKESHGHREKGHDVGGSPNWSNSTDEVKDYVLKQYGIDWDGASGRQLLAELQKQHVSQPAIQRIMARLMDNPYAKPLSNATVKCSRCGAHLGPDGELGIEHGYDHYCVDCAVEKGYIDEDQVP